MDLIFPYKNKFWMWTFLVTSLFCSVAYSWRVSHKCPHGHFYNDGCTACWCDTRTGVTRCERLHQCARINNVNCPRGRRFKDDCGNECTCYESTGAVFCNEKRKCPPMQHASNTNTAFQRRGGLAVADEELYRLVNTPPPPSLPIRNEFYNTPMSFASTPASGGFLNTPNPNIPNTNIFTRAAISPSTPTSSNFHNTPYPPRSNIFGTMTASASTPTPPAFLNTPYPPRSNIFGTMTASASTPTAAAFLNTPSNNGNIFDGISISSTPHSHLRIPNRSQELIIEPAIIIRKKGSNKASVVRNPSSATSVTLSSRHDPSFVTPTGSSSTILLHPNDKPSNLIQNTLSRLQTAPLNLYEKQLKTILDIKRAYAQLLRSKLNLNLHFPQNPQNNSPFQRVVVLQENSNPGSSTTEHPRRFDSSFKNTTFVNTTPSSIFSSSQQPKPPSQKPYQTFWRKPEVIRKEIKNAFKHFSPVPQLTQMMSYVTSSTESYLSQFINFGKKQQQQNYNNNLNNNFNIVIPETTTSLPPPTTDPWYNSLPSSSQEPYHEVNPFDHNEIPIHQIYQNHDFSSFLTTTPSPPPLSNQDSYQHKMSFSSYYPNQFQKSKDPNSPHKFPYMTELLHELARADHFPRSTPRTTSGLTAVPTFQTPGPPYAEVDVVQPLSFLPPPRPEPATPTHRSFIVRPPPRQPHHNPRPTVRANIDKPIYLPSVPFNRRNFMKPPPFHIHRQFVNPKPKQYRLTLKGGMRDAAVKVDDVVPRFVSRIAHEFFKKPEIYVPKIRPGKPLTLEKVVLNHKEMVPKEVTFHPGEPPTKLRFTPEAQWEMKSDLAKHGIMLDEPLNPVRDYAANDPNVMVMDSPVHAVQTFENHQHMGISHIPEYNPEVGINIGISSTDLNDKIHHPLLVPQQAQAAPHFPILYPSPTPTPVVPSFDLQHQQELQHQLQLAQQQINEAAASGSSNAFTFDASDMDDFKRHSEEDVLPQELQIPGVQQVVVDKYIVHDPMNPSGPIVFSTTTVEPPLANNNQFPMNHHRAGVPMMTSFNSGPTPSSVLVRHHGAPSPSTTQAPPQNLNGAMGAYNYMYTVINSTPSPPVTSTFPPQLSVPQMNPTSGVASVSTGIVSQIQDMLANQMDFAARPQTDLFEMLFHSRIGVASNTHLENPLSPHQFEAVAESDEEGTKEAVTDDQIANETKVPGEVDTDRVANIFSMDYKYKYGKKPPEVIVIKVPEGHSDGPFPKIVEKRKGDEIEIIGGRSRTSSSKKNATKPFLEEIITSTENSIATSTSKPVDSSESSGTSDGSSNNDRSSSKQRRKKNKKKKRKKKGKNRNRDLESDTPKNEDTSKETLEPSPPNTAAEEKFQAELDWKSQLMANICELNPTSPLCLTYRSICLLMTSDSE